MIQALQNTADISPFLWVAAITVTSLLGAPIMTVAGVGFIAAAVGRQLER